MDEVPCLIGKTTAWEGFPDSKVADIGYHYFNWYYVNAGDGNGLDADLNQDEIVNFGDFAILADGWETTYDINDVEIMADEWLRIAEPNIQLQIDDDANDGFVEFGATGYTYDTQRIFLLIDGEYAGEIFGFRDGYPLGVDVSEYSGGEQQFKAVSIDSTGQVTCSNIKIIDFNCPLNYCFLPSSYEPNKPLYFSAFNPTDGNVTVKVYADCGNLVWSQDYNGVSFFDYIPAEVTGQHEIDYVSFDTSGGELLIAGTGGSITKISDPAEPELQGSVRALIILPNFLIRTCDYRTIGAVRTAFKNKGVKYVKLGGNSANYDTIKFYAKTNPIKYIYIGTHGGDGKEIIPETGKYYYEFDRGIRRTWVQLSDGRCVSMKQSDSGAPSWCQHLGFWEKRSKSFASIGFEFLEFAYFDSCYSGRLTINDDDELVEGQPGQIGQVFDAPISDMSIALGIHEPSESRIYHGWYIEIPVGLPWPLPEDEYRKWTRLLWERLGDEDNLDAALTYVINHQTEFGPDDPVNNYRLKGQGFLSDIFIRDH